MNYVRHTETSADPPCEPDTFEREDGNTVTIHHYRADECPHCTRGE